MCTKCNLVKFYTVIFMFSYVINGSQSLESNECPITRDKTIQNNIDCELDYLAKESSVMNIIMRFGYPAEKHKVTTLDGYILTVFRIPNTTPKHTVFLHHGWQTSAINFFGRGRDSLPFLLADAGYDVWLANARGTRDSEEHVNLTVNDPKFWKYSEDEIALYDLPAQLEYVHKLTKQNGRIIYIAYSMGSTVSLFYSTSFPENAKSLLRILIFMGPSGKLTYTKSPLLRYINPFFKPTLQVLFSKNLIRLASQSSILRTALGGFCLKSPLHTKLCVNTMNSFFAGAYSGMDSKTIPVYFNQAPAGGSFQLLVHLADFVLDNFRHYDYGVHNIEKYGTRHAPEYNLSKLEIPVVMFYAINDWVTTKEDAIILYNTIPPETRFGIYEIRERNFNHVDYLYGHNVRSLLYDNILAIINNLN